MIGRWASVAGGLLAFLAAGPIVAQEGDAIRYAVLDVVGVGRVETEQVEGLSALLASEIGRRPGVSVIRSSEIRAMLGFEAEKQLLGCAEGSCLAEIGGALGVDFLVQSEVTEVGGTWLLSLVLLDVQEARATRRVSREASAESGLIVALRDGVTELMAELQPAAMTLPPRASGRMGALRWVGMGMGAAAAVAGGVVYGGALGKYFHTKRAPSEVSKSERLAAESRYPIGIGLLGGGAVLAAAALLWPSGGDEPSIAVLPTQGGVVVSMTLRFDGPEGR